MKCFLAISILIVLAKNLFKRNKVVGCVQSLQERSLNEKVTFFQIDFSNSCKNLANCIKKKNSREICEDNFKEDMDDECFTYCRGENVTIKNFYCSYVSRNNLNVILDLPNTAFEEYVEYS